MSFQVVIGALGGTIFPGETWYLSANYPIFILVCWYRRPNSAKMGNIHFFTLTFSFAGRFLDLKLRKTYFQVRKYT